MDSDNLFQKIWDEQLRYNESLGKLCPERDSPARWTEILLLGLVAECEEILREIGWKRHRGNRDKLRKIPRQNLAFELADATKYCLSLWQIWGFDAHTALMEIARKNSVMKMRLEQEFMPIPPAGTRVLVVDLDGTLADLRFGLYHYGLNIERLGYLGIRHNVKTLNADVDFGMDYRRFQEMKTAFIESGGYATLPPLKKFCEAVINAIDDGVHVIAVTDRPVETHPRLWLESLSWLHDQGLKVKALHAGSDVRIRLLLELAEAKCDVVLFDDNPDIIERSLNSGLKVVCPAYPYNAYLKDRVRYVALTDGTFEFPFEPAPRNASDSGQAVPVPSGEPG